MKERKPIFYDAEKIRWRFTRRVLEISGVLLTLAAGVFLRDHRRQRGTAFFAVARHAARLITR